MLPAMTDESRQTAPHTSDPEPGIQPPPPAGGASDATLIIFLIGVMLMLAVCVVFILVAS
jgi:hypothetical protein